VHRLLLARVNAAVPLLQGFLDVVLVIATLRMVVDPDPEIVIIPIVVMIEPVIVDVGHGAAAARPVARAAAEKARRTERFNIKRITSPAFAQLPHSHAGTAARFTLSAGNSSMAPGLARAQSRNTRTSAARLTSC
jgi:hypothetical protein